MPGYGCRSIVPKQETDAGDVCLRKRPRSHREQELQFILDERELRSPNAPGERARTNDAEIGRCVPQRYGSAIELTIESSGSDAKRRRNRRRSGQHAGPRSTQSVDGIRRCPQGPNGGTRMFRLPCRRCIRRGAGSPTQPCQSFACRPLRKCRCRTLLKLANLLLNRSKTVLRLGDRRRINIV